MQPLQTSCLPHATRLSQSKFHNLWPEGEYEVEGTGVHRQAYPFWLLVQLWAYLTHAQLFPGFRSASASASLPRTNSIWGNQCRYAYAALPAPQPEMPRQQVLPEIRAAGGLHSAQRHLATFITLTSSMCLRSQRCLRVPQRRCKWV